MNALFILLISMTGVFAEAPQAKTESEKQCLKDVEDKHKSIKQAQGSCKWELPKVQGGDRSVGVAPQCSAYEKIGNKWELRKYAYSRTGYKGTLVCGNSENANKDSYLKQTPVFAYQCSECTTVDTSGGVDESCLKTMYDQDVANCTYNPKMRYDHQTGKSVHRDTGEVIK